MSKQTQLTPPTTDLRKDLATWQERLIICQRRAVKKIKKARRVLKRWLLYGRVYFQELYQTGFTRSCHAFALCYKFSNHTLSIQINGRIKSSYSKILQYIPLWLPASPDFPHLIPFIGLKATQLETKLGQYLWRYGTWVAMIVFGAVSAHHLWYQYATFTSHPQASLYRQINFWPTLPVTTIILADASFEQGNAPRTHAYLAQAQQQIIDWDQWGLGWIFRPYYQRIAQQFVILEKKRQALDEVTDQLEQYPYALSLLWKQAKLLAELSHPTELADTLTLIRWLDPQQNTEVIEKQLIQDPKRSRSRFGSLLDRR